LPGFASAGRSARPSFAGQASREMGFNGLAHADGYVVLIIV
jgi:hypothetical protein